MDVTAEHAAQDRDRNAVTDFIVTYSGRKIEGPGGEGFPTLEDVAVQTGRITRWTGVTSRWWSILHHHLAAERIARWRGEPPRVRLLAAIHDAHEIATSDVPAPFKGPEVRAFQAELDRRTHAGWGIGPFAGAEGEIVHGIDRELLLAEGQLLTRWGDIEEVPPSTTTARLAVEIILSYYPDPRDTVAPRGQAVQEYTKIVEDLIEEVRYGG